MCITVLVDNEHVGYYFYILLSEGKRMDTLKEHLRKIARDRQAKLKKKLGKKKYSEYMSSISKRRVSKKRNAKN